jgi:hypothetical protein
VSGQVFPVDLRLHEDDGSSPSGGHTIRDHVTISDDDLKQRLFFDPKIPSVSKFTTLDIAQTVVNATLQSKAAEVTLWLATGKPSYFELDIGRPVGHGFNRIRSKVVGPSPLTKVRVILRRTPGPRWGQILILTSFPVK